MNQPSNQQHKQQPAPEWKPNAGTIFLVLTDEEFAPRARKHVNATHGRGERDSEGNVKPWHIVTELNPQWLKLNNTIVVLYTDPDKGILENGAWRDRKPGKKSEGGRWLEQPEPPMVMETKPIDLKPYWRPEGYGEGVDRHALCREISKRVTPCRAQLDDRAPAAGSRDPQYTISVRAV